MIKKKVDVTAPQTLFSEAFGDAALDFRFYTFEAGARIPAEGAAAHEEEEFSYILSGTLIGESGGEPFKITAGEASYIPSGEMHWSHNPGDEPATLIAIMLKTK